MAKVTSVTYRRGITLNVGDFESVRVDIEATGEVESGEDFQKAYETVKDQVDEAVRAEARIVRSKARNR